MTAFEDNAIERAVLGLRARLIRLNEISAASADDPLHASSRDVWRDLLDGALRDCEAIETMTLKSPAIDYSKASLNLRLMHTLADVIATRSDGLKRALLDILEKIRGDPAAEELVAGWSPQEPIEDRRWSRKPAGLPATIAHTSARVVDVSYGGMRLELAASPADVNAPIEVAFPSLGFSLNAIPRWSKPTGSSGAWWCGVEVTAGDPVAQRTWQGLVDSVS